MVCLLDKPPQFGSPSPFARTLVHANGELALRLRRCSVITATTAYERHVALNGVFDRYSVSMAGRSVPSPAPQVGPSSPDRRKDRPVCQLQARQSIFESSVGARLSNRSSCVSRTPVAILGSGAAHSMCLSGKARSRSSKWEALLSSSQPAFDRWWNGCEVRTHSRQVAQYDDRAP